MNRRVLSPSLAMSTLLATQLLLVPVPAKACAVLPEPQQIKRDAEDLEALVRHVREVASKATHIFVARAGEVEVTSEDREVDGAMQEFEISRPSFIEVIATVKGAGDTSGLYWEENVTTIKVGCGIRSFEYGINMMPTYRYIVYARGSEILRAAIVVDWDFELATDVELSLVRK